MTRRTKEDYAALTHLSQAEAARDPLDALMRRAARHGQLTLSMGIADGRPWHHAVLVLADRRHGKVAVHSGTHRTATAALRNVLDQADLCKEGA